MPRWMDTRRAPLVTFTFPATYTFEELDDAFNEIEAYYERLVARSTAPVGLLVDAMAVESSSARNRKRIADSIERLEPALGPRAVGQAFAMRTPIARGGLTALLWIRNPGWPVKVFPSRAEAEAWLVERFAEVGATVPPA